MMYKLDIILRPQAVLLHSRPLSTESSVQRLSTNEQFHKLGVWTKRHLNEFDVELKKIVIVVDGGALQT